MKLSWEKLEERFASLVRLGGDPRTPDNERRNACEAAVAMFRKGDMTVVSTGRWESMMLLYRQQQEMIGTVPRTRLGCRAPFNINGKNGWQCCQCMSFNTSVMMRIMGRGWGPNHCEMCGHARCDAIMQEDRWNTY